MIAYIYQIEALSNLHAGSGEANEGVIDNLIQRDSVTGLPIVNASSLKGALREHFKGQDKDLIKHVFGSEVNNPENERKAGAYRFFDARLLAIPVRSDKAPYLMATSPMVLKDYLRTLDLFGLTADKDLEQLAQQTPDTPKVANLTYDQARIEDLEKPTACEPLNGLSAWLGNASVLLPDSDFRTLCDNDHLPVFARNYLNDGQSENLWYEQVLPRFSRLYFAVLVPDGDTRFKDFNAHITGSLVQIGANATVGYGYCRLTNVSNPLTLQP